MSETFHFSEGSLRLNQDQSRIVRSAADVNMRVIASAGSGKTSTLTGRISHLLTSCGAKPSQILLLTFTHNAALVMRQRLQVLIGPQPILCGTFHAISQQILRQQHPESLQDVYHVDELPLKALDYLQSPVGQKWVTNTLRWIFIDEYQDINDTQYAMIRAFHHPSATVTIVGDDAQNIYSWRGSCVDYILNFDKKFPDVSDFQLSTNYRSSPAIVAVANSVMRYIPTLPYKELMTAARTDYPAERPEVHYFARTSEERDWVTESAVKAMTLGSTVILSKFNSVLYAYEAAFLKMGVRVRFVQGDHDDSTRSVNPIASTGHEPTVFLSTFHGSKGLEWDHVFLVRMNDEVFPQQKDEDSVLQERRLFYVAVTRARRTLTITYSRHEKSLSRFVREVHRPLLQWRNIPFYEMSNLSSNLSAVTVRDWVNYLSGEDYRLIKQLNVLPAVFRNPAAFTPTSPPQPQHRIWVTPYWWAEQGMAMEFFDFLRAFWHREVAILRPESGGQWDRDAQQVIWTIKIAAEDATVFESHRPLFETLAERFFGATPRGEAPPQINYTEILTAIHQIQPHRQWEQAELIRIIQIIHKMRTVLYNLRFANVALQDFRFAPIRHSPPQESRCPLIEAWRLYTDGHPLSTGEPIALQDLNSIYQVGLCRAIGEGRSGVLSALPGEREWSRVRDFLGVFRTRIRTLLESARTQTVLCRVQTRVKEGVTSEADLVIGTTAWFFVAGDQVSEIQRLDRFLTVLLTVYGLREAGHTITRICLFQLITGTTLELSVEDWSESASSLLVAFIQARVQHTMGQNI
jgi:hypothetical protein